MNTGKIIIISFIVSVMTGLILKALNVPNELNWKLIFFGGSITFLTTLVLALFAMIKSG